MAALERPIKRRAVVEVALRDLDAFVFQLACGRLLRIANKGPDAKPMLDSPLNDRSPLVPRCSRDE